MNPFDFRGPQFLVFYFLLAVATLIALHAIRRRRELALLGGELPRLHDPYAIAFLRDGRHEMLRVAVLSLVDRGLLAVPQKVLTVTRLGQETQVRKRVEEDLLRYCVMPRQPEELFRSDAFEVAAAEYEYVLEKERLFADDEITRMRQPLFAAAAAILILVSIVKIVVALSRGRSNVEYLILFTIAAVIAAQKVAFPRLTVRGTQFLAELTNLFRSLKVRAAEIRLGGANADLVLAAAVFGMNVLPYRDFSWIWKFFPKGGSSSNSSCGSSCGGGGCGGGCGGCGG